jgi:hypothetical protein
MSIAFGQYTDNTTQVLSSSNALFLQITGSLTKTQSGLSAFVASDGISITSSSSDQVIISNTISGSSNWTPANLSPYNWWKASSTSKTSGLVTTIFDSGSAAKNFTAIVGQRGATKTDAAGKTYLDCTSGTLYTAGVAADWAWMHSGSLPYTIFVVLQHATGGSATEGILTTMNWSGSGIGMMIAHGNTTVPEGYDFGIWNGSNKIYLAGSRNIVHTGSVVWAFQFSGEIIPTQIGQFTGNPAVNTTNDVATCWRQGVKISKTPRTLTTAFSTANPNGTLTLGAFANGAVPLTAALYEIVIIRRAVTAYEIYQYAAYASGTYGFQLI